MKKNLPRKSQGSNRTGLRPRVQPGKAKTTFARARAPVQVQKTKAGPTQRKAVSQKLAIQRLNKARATLQKAVKAVSVANKNLAKTMPAEKAAQKKNRSNSLARGGNNTRPSKSPQKKNQQLNRSGQFGRVGNKGKIQKRQIKRGDVAIKFNNRGPSGHSRRGRGRVNVVRDTLKNEKPATSLDDRFSQLLKSAGRTANRSNRGGGGNRGGNARRGGGGGNRGRGASRGGSNRGNNRNRRF
jgi:hypothetical protein